VEIRKGTRGDIQKAERGIYNRAGLGNTRLKQRNASRSRYIELCNRRGIVDKV